MDGGDKTILWIKWVFLGSVAWFVGFIIGLWFGGYIAIALVQWFILRHLSNGIWLLGLGLGGAVVGWFGSKLIVAILSLGMGGEFLLIATTVEGALFGFIFGLAQWFYLRRLFHQAGLWILACIIAWSIGPFLSLSISWHGLISASVTGLALIWLLGRPQPDADLSSIIPEVPPLTNTGGQQ